MKDLSKEYQDDMKKQIMHLKEQYNKTLMVGIGWISTQSRFFRIKQIFLLEENRPDEVSLRLDKKF